MPVSPGAKTWVLLSGSWKSFILKTAFRADFAQSIATKFELNPSVLKRVFFGWTLLYPGKQRKNSTPLTWRTPR